MNTLTNEGANREGDAGVGNIDNSAAAQPFDGGNVNLVASGNIPKNEIVVTPANNININSNINSNEEVAGNLPPSLMVHIGNTSTVNACNITKESFHQLLSFYPVHCMTSEEVEER